MPVRLKDLSPAARAQVDAALAKPATRVRSRRQVTQAEGRCPQVCRCGHRTDDWPEMERHLEQEDHTRASIDFARLEEG